MPTRWQTNGFSIDPNAKDDRFYAHPRVHVRLTHNLDKDRGFVNDAVGVVHTVLQTNGPTPLVFTVVLSTGVLLLVHPVRIDKKTFFPRTYGYATTVRKAQGASRKQGCLYFDHCFPPDRGYGYVAASRFTTRAGIFLYDRVRRTDWLPVNGDASSEQIKISCLSDSDKAPDEDDAGYEREEDELLNPPSEAEALTYPEYDQRTHSDVSDVATDDGYYDDDGFAREFGGDDDYAAMDRALPFYNSAGDAIDGDISVLIP